jgi:SAM-dependent methyltransferase
MLERILLLLCRPEFEIRAQIAAWESHTTEPDGDPLAHLSSRFPELRSLVEGRSVLDFGCGAGRQAVALARSGASEVVGLDINEEYLEAGVRYAAQLDVGDRVRFASNDDGAYDVIISQNSMEHFKDPAAALRTMKRALKPGGVILMTFSPPWLHPYGAHSGYITSLPWAHLLFPERVMMAVRGRFQDDGATRYEDVTGGLNRMTLSKFERLVRENGLKMRNFEYVAIKRLPIVTSIPVIREFLTAEVFCTLESISDT